MSRRRVRERRDDFRGGLNTLAAPYQLAKTELRGMLNVRCGPDGTLTKRPGVQLVATLPSPIIGLTHYRNAAAQQHFLAVLETGAVYTIRTDLGPPYTPVLATGASLGTGVPVGAVVPLRNGTAIDLYLVGGNLRVWKVATGSSPVVVSQVNAADTRSWVTLAHYQGRLWLTRAGKNTLVASKPNDWEVWTLPDALEEDVENFSNEPLTGLLPLGQSLLLFKEDSIARLTGNDPDSLNIALDTAGVAQAIGSKWPATLVTLEQGGAFLSDRGMFSVTETGVRDLSEKVRPTLASLPGVPYWQMAAVHRARRELWLAVTDTPGFPAATSFPGSIYAYNLETGGWSGPWRFGTDGPGQPALQITAMCEYEDPTGAPGIALAHGDALVIADTGTSDLNGNPIAMQAELPVITHGVPGDLKSWRPRQLLHADLGDGAELLLRWATEEGEGALPIPSRGAGLRPYPFALAARGRQLTLTLSESSDKAVAIHGLDLEAMLVGHA